MSPLWLERRLLFSAVPLTIEHSAVSSAFVTQVAKSNVLVCLEGKVFLVQNGIFQFSTKLVGINDQAKNEVKDEQLLCLFSRPYIPCSPELCCRAVLQPAVDTSPYSPSLSSQPWKHAGISSRFTTTRLLSPCAGSVSLFAALLPSTHFQISFFFLERHIAGPSWMWTLGNKRGM